jgi:hypothetical protein
VQLRNPILINDVHQQTALLDRREVYKKLAEHLVPTPRHIVVNRTEQQAATGEDPEDFVETPDYVSLVHLLVPIRCSAGSESCLLCDNGSVTTRVAGPMTDY